MSAPEDRICRCADQTRPRRLGVPNDVPEEALSGQEGLRRSRSRLSRAFAARGSGVGARLNEAGAVSGASAGWEGRSRPGRRPARRGSLEGPGVSCRQPYSDQTARWAVLVAQVCGWAQRTSPLLIGNDQRPPWFGGTDIPSFRFRAHGVFPATVKTGSLSYPGHARSAGGHVVRRARVLAVPEPSQLASWRARQRISPSRSP